MHENVEKYIMNIRDAFSEEVLEEAQYLMDNQDSIPDPDERLRRSESNSQLELLIINQMKKIK